MLFIFASSNGGFNISILSIPFSIRFLLSVMLNKPFDFENERFLQSVQKIFDICKDNNISSGIFCDDEIKAKRYYEMGANVLWVATDNNFFMRGYNDMMNKVMEIK